MMRDRFFMVASLTFVGLGMITVAFPDGTPSILIVLLLSMGVIFLIRKYSDEKDFLTTVFLGALVCRLAFGVFVHVFDLRVFFGEDAIAYDYLGNALAEYWSGLRPGDDPLVQIAGSPGPGWGMNYLVALIYKVVGRNILAAQSFCAVFGAATAPLLYYCAMKVYANKGVAKIAAICVAVFPAFILWSSQLMKDGLIVFLLVLVITMVLQLQKKLNVTAIAILVLSMFGIIALRFYIFYMIAVAVVGTFAIGVSGNTQSLLRRLAVLILLGLGLTYLGVIRNATTNMEIYGSLERIQISREDLATSAESGFGADADVSTAEGALTTLPVGFIYLMFAPFPWEMSNLRQTITLPEVLVWWSMIPLMVIGIWYTIKNRLRNAIPILIFTLMLTLAYSIFQGNVGTAYRQRTQIQVFLFIFIAVGWTFLKEKRENRQVEKQAKERLLEQRLRSHRIK